MNMDDEDDESLMRKVLTRIEDLSKGVDSPELETLAMEGLKVVHADKGLIRSRFVIPNGLSDEYGNWHVGAMTILMDNLGCFVATLTSSGHFHSTVDLNISFFSTAKIQEEVEIEAKTVAEKGRLRSVVVEVRKTDINGQVIALGRQWMTSIKKRSPPSKI